MGPGGRGRALPLLSLCFLLLLLFAGLQAAESSTGGHNGTTASPPPVGGRGYNATTGGGPGVGGGGHNATGGGLHGASGGGHNSSTGGSGKRSNATSGSLHGTGGRSAHGNSSHAPHGSRGHNASADSLHGIAGLSLDANGTLRTVSDRTVRVDPLDGFKKYRRGYDITNKHYWSSLFFTGIPGYAIAVVWLLGGAVYVLYRLLATCCTNRAEKYAKKADFDARKPRVWPVAVAMLLTISVLVTSGVALAGSYRFHSSAFSIRRILGHVGDDASTTIANITGAVTAMQFNPVAFKEIERLTRLNSTSQTLTEVAAKIQDKAEKSVNLIGKGLKILRTTTTVIVALNLATILALLGSRFLRLNRTLQMLLVVCWLMTAFFWMLFGLYFFLGGFAGDTCTALADYRQDPRNSSLGAILPCSSQASGNSALKHTRAGIHNLINKVNKNISTIQTNLRQHPLGIICNPFSAPPEYLYQPDRCAENTTKIGDIPEVLKRFTCSWSEEGSGCGAGRFIPSEDLRAVSIYTSSVQTLLDSFPAVERLVDCQLVKDAFAQVLFTDCKPLRKYAKMSWACMAAASTIMVLLALTWVAMELRGDQSHDADGSVIPRDHSPASTPDRKELAEKRELPLLQP